MPCGDGVLVYEGKRTRIGESFKRAADARRESGYSSDDGRFLHAHQGNIKETLNLHSMFG